MLHEIGSNDFTTFVQEHRKVKDAYSQRKVQKDRLKAKMLLDGLLADRDVIVFYMEDGVEKQVVGTTKKLLPLEVWEDLPVPPLTTEIVNNKEVLENQYCTFYKFPTKEPVMVHIDNVTKFIVVSKGIDYNFYVGLRNAKDDAKRQ
jgi:hypothetical protein